MKKLQRTVSFSAALCCLSLSFAAVATSQRGVTPTTPVPLKSAQQQEVVINDQAVLTPTATDQRFSLAHTLGAILTSAGQENTPANQRTFLQTMITTFNAQASTENNPVTGFPEPLTARPGEAALKPAHMLDATDTTDFMFPVAVFNRLDLAPANFANCGEYRIVYEKVSGKGNPVNRMTLIFEGALDNPNPKAGAKGCLPIAQFWASLKSLKGNDLASALEAFYYTGIPGVNPGNPVVSIKSYGNPFGQVRANLFVNNPNLLWQLRQWLVKKSGSTIAFAMDPVANSPMPILYSVPSTEQAPGTFEDLTKQYQQQFIKNYMSQLTAIDSKGAKGVTDSQLFFGLGMQVRIGQDGFESTSNGNPGTPQEEDPNILVSQIPGNTHFLTNISNAIPSLNLPWALTPQQILSRAGSQSCGGCHQFETVQDIAPSSQPEQTIIWPFSGGFVQIEESGGLSPLLTQRFLPSRFANLENFISTNGASVEQNLTAGVSPSQVAGYRSQMNQPGGASTTLVEELRQEDLDAPGGFIAIRPAD